MHWHIYLVLAVGGLCVVILDLVLGRWARAGMMLLMVATMGLAAWNGREDERKARAEERDAREPDAPRE
jgi:type IV secretory pathway TrbD component